MALDRLRILHLIDTPGPGGAETVFLDLVQGLDPTRWESVPVSPQKGWLTEVLERSGIKPVILPTRGSFDFAYLLQLRDIISGRRIDLIQTHLMTTSVYGTLASALLGPPVISTFHGLPDVSVGSRFNPVKFGVLGRGSNKIVFVSDSLRSAFVELGLRSSRNLRVIPNGIDCEIFKPGAGKHLKGELGLPKGAILAGAVGNIRPPKGYKNLILACAEIRKRREDFYLAIAGDPKEPLYSELLALRSRLGLDAGVFFLGFRDDIPELLRSLDLFLLSSTHEGFSLATIQAMASGLPVVATASGGPQEIIEDGVSGRLVPPDDPMALSAASLEILSSPSEMVSLGRGARARVDEDFSKTAMVQRYEALYRECMSLEGAVPLGAGDRRSRNERMEYGR